ncbi:MAG TPA: hypothetical protein VJ732_12485, partial [Bryobacteraceae bacterium]|nr:hypothetical protein [Bryobacteraceae bacterium]
HALPARDRVMLVRADGLATPATVFEPDHRKVETAIAQSQPGSTALNLDQALTFARHIQAQSGRRAGEIAFVGSPHTTGENEAAAALPRNLRVLLVPDALANSGLRKIGARRSASEPDLWEINASAHNYGSAARKVTISLDFGPPPGMPGPRSAAGSQSLTLPPGGDADAAFQLRTSAAGILGVNLLPHDVLPADDHADLELPAQPLLHVTVYSNEPDLLRPLFAANPRVAAVYRSPDQYRADDAGLVVLDRLIPPRRPAADSIWIDPPAQGSPVPVRQTAEQASFSRWNISHPAAAGLRTKDFKLEKTSVFAMAPGDTAIGEVEAGPVIVARDSKPKIVVFGFHPALSAMRYALATPLLFANLLRWVSPELFHRWEISGGSVGTLKLLLDQDTAATDAKVTAQDGSPLPFTVSDRTLHFFTATPGTVRVTTGDREYVYSLSLPQLWDTRWEPPAGTPRTVPSFPPVFESSTDLWPLLALLGAAGLIAEWLLYGRFRRAARHTMVLEHSRRSATLRTPR